MIKKTLTLNKITTTEFLKFICNDWLNHKTKVIEVKNKGAGCHLGVIQWEKGWRRYVFHPANYTFFDSKCLSDITHYIDELMEERKNGQT